MNRPTQPKIIFPILLAIAAIFIIAHYKPSTLFHSRTSITKFTDTTDGSLEDYYQLGQSLSVRGFVATTSATFLTAGDIMLSRNVAAAIKKADDTDLPFRGMSDILKSVDFNFGNLESPVAPPLLNKEGCPPQGGGVVGGHSMVFGAPCAYIKGLADFNFQIVNLANNHALDQGLAGIDATKLALDNLNIQHEGTGDNLDQAWQPATVDANGIKVCFIGASYSSVNDGGKTTNNYVARIEDTAHLQSAITTAKSECDFIVATMHAGTEYTRTPNAAQIKFAHAAIDDGADMIIGSHPHWIQTIEKYCPVQYSPPNLGGVSRAIVEGRGGISQANTLPPPPPAAGTPPVPGGEAASCPNPKYIFYSLGNFIFDQMWSQETKEGLTLKITLSKIGATPVSPSFSKEGAGLSAEASAKAEGSSLSADDLQGSRIPAKLESVELIPVIIQNSQPRPATADEAKKILDKIGQTETILK